MGSAPIQNGFGGITSGELEEIQSQLLVLLKEFDQICRDNSVTYYLDGGSVIGALRHKGFIPWDDDVDILIKREDFDRLRPVLEEIGRKRTDRCFSYLLSDYSHHRPFARFINTEVLCVSRNLVLEANSLPGIFLDIFILDGFEDKFLSKYRHVLECSEEWFHWRLNGVVGKCSLFEYCMAMFLEGRLGEKRVANYYINKLERFERKSKRIDYYVPRNGFNYAVYDADVFQEPKYVEFEGGLFPVPTKPEKYLRAHYSTDWFNIPPEDSRYSHHFVLTSEVFKPVDFKESFNWFKHHPSLHAVQRKRHFFQVIRKKYVIARQASLARQVALIYELEMKNSFLKVLPLSKLSLLEAGREFDRIRENFIPYLVAQKKLLSNYPLAKKIIRLPSGYDYFLIKSLIMTGRIFEAERLVKLLGEPSIESKPVVDVLEKIINVECALQDKEYELAVDLIESLPKEYSYSTAVAIYKEKLNLVSFNQIDFAVEFYESLQSKNGFNFDIADIIASYLVARGEVQKAEAIYKGILSAHNNGLVLMAVKDKLIALERAREV